MTTAKTSPAAAPPKFASMGSPYFGIMLAVMAVVLILSNIGASKGVAIGPIITDGGFFLFPLAYILGDVISEVYGFKVARKAIVTTFALSVFASLCYWVIIALPGFDDDTAPPSRPRWKAPWDRCRRSCWPPCWRSSPARPSTPGSS